MRNELSDDFVPIYEPCCEFAYDDDLAVVGLATKHLQHLVFPGLKFIPCSFAAVGDGY